MRILFDNKANLSDIVITNQNQNINYPCENLLHDFLELDYRASDTEDQIDIKFNKPITADSIFFGFHNLRSIMFQLYDSRERVLLDRTVNKPQQNGAEFFDSLTDVKKFKIIVSAKSGQVAALLGGIAIGDAYTMPDPLNTWGFGFEDNSFKSSTPSGQILINQVKPLRTGEYAFRNVSLETTKEILKLYQTYTGSHIWVDAFEDTDFIKQAVYSTIQEISPPKREVNARTPSFSFSIKIKEAR